jgi:outer membrane lipoprotein-sorting protein
MREKRKINELFKDKLKTSASPELDRRIDSLIAQTDEKQTQTSNTWRLIMKNRITKFAVAASVLIAIVLSITIFDNTVTPVYAIEQTIEAMRSLSSIHAYCTDWDGSQGEVWIQTNPETGQEEYCYADIGKLLIVATPQTTYYYHKDKNLVRIKKEYVPASQISFSRIFEELPNWVQNHGGKYEINNEFDEELQKEVILIHVDLPIYDKEQIIRIDPKTKLPINIEAIKSKPGQGVKSTDRLEYNLSIPEGIFEFEIPEGAKVVYE